MSRGLHCCTGAMWAAPADSWPRRGLKVRT